VRREPGARPRAGRVAAAVGRPEPERAFQVRADRLVDVGAHGPVGRQRVGGGAMHQRGRLTVGIGRGHVGDDVVPEGEAFVLDPPEDAAVGQRRGDPHCGVVLEVEGRGDPGRVEHVSSGGGDRRHRAFLGGEPADPAGDQ
jgi:hypothetical protein